MFSSPKNISTQHNNFLFHLQPPEIQHRSKLSSKYFLFYFEHFVNTTGEQSYTQLLLQGIKKKKILFPSCFENCQTLFPVLWHIGWRCEDNFSQPLSGKVLMSFSCCRRTILQKSLNCHFDYIPNGGIIIVLLMLMVESIARARRIWKSL